MVDITSSQTKPNHIYLIYIHKEDLAITYNWWYALEPNQTKSFMINKYV